MVTPLQEAIFEELDKYTSTETMRDKAQEIADNVAKNEHIASCSKTYVMRMIKRREDSSSKVQIKVAPPEPKEEEEELEVPDDEFDEDEAEDDWAFDEEEPESDSDEEPKKSPQDTPIEELIDKKAAKTLVVVPFRMISDWTGYDGFQLTEEETKQLVPVIRPMLIKYVPDLLGQYFPEIICAFVVLSVLGPKIKGYREFQEEKVKTEKAQVEAAKSAKEAEQRRLQEEERQRLEEETRRQTPPEPVPHSKDDPANTPSWQGKGRSIG